MGYTIDIDTGGTFTDGFFTHGKRFETVKVDTTPHDLTVCFMECVKEGAKRFGLNDARDILKDTDVVRFSTTIGTNALLEKAGTKIGLIVTKGFEETVYHSNGDNPLFDFVLARDMVIGIREEVSAEGEVVIPVDEKEVRESIKKLLEKGARMIVISLKGSAVNPVHERMIRELINRDYPKHYLGSVPLLLASQISIRPDPSLRSNTASVNAYLHQSLARSLYKADEEIRLRNYTKPLLIVHSTGGVARVAKTTAVHTYNSGPVAGLYGALEMGRLYNLNEIITLDVGGTSADIGLIHDGHFEKVYPSNLEGIPVDFPMIHVDALGAGGGSIAHIDSSKRIVVGPQSAGAMPGPACYGLGGSEPTLTDSYLALGYIDPDYFMGGEKNLDKELALEAIQGGLASHLGMKTEEAAFEIKEFVIRRIGEKISHLIKDKGLDPKDVVLFAFGGGGGCVCCDVAGNAGIPRIYLFPHSSVFCAFGSSVMDVLHLYEDSRKIVLRSESGRYLDDFDEYNQIIAGLQQRSFRDMKGEGFSPEEVHFQLELEVSGEDGSEPVIVEHPDLFFHDRKDVERLCSLFPEKASGEGKLGIEIFRLTAFCPTPHYTVKTFGESGESPEKALKGRRGVYWGEMFKETSVYGRKLLKSGNVVYGPAVIEAEDTTCVVPEGKRYRVDQYLNGVIEEVE